MTNDRSGVGKLTVIVLGLLVAGIIIAVVAVANWQNVSNNNSSNVRNDGVEFEDSNTTVANNAFDNDDRTSRVTAPESYEQAVNSARGGKGNASDFANNQHSLITLDKRAQNQLDIAGVPFDDVQIAQFKFKAIVEVLDDSEISKIIADVQAITGAEPTRRFTNVLNGFAIEATYQQINQIKLNKSLRLTYDDAVIPADFEANDIANVTQVHTPSGSGGLGYRGEGIVVAVLDSGVDCRHKDFAPGIVDVSRIGLSEATARTQIATLEHGTFCSNKVPYTFNYADFSGKNDVDDNDQIDTYIGEEGNWKTQEPTMHGQHVAGIIAANGSARNDVSDPGVDGSAPEAQILNMKIFSNAAAGAWTRDIVSALDDCFVLRPDVINMSVGSNAGTGSFDVYNPEVIAINKLAEIGVVTVISAGNSAQLSSDSENWQQADVDDDTTIGSPGTTREAITVGAAENSVSRTSVGRVVYSTDTSATDNTQVIEFSDQFNLADQWFNDEGPDDQDQYIQIPTNATTDLTVNQDDLDHPWPDSAIGQSAANNWLGIAETNLPINVAPTSVTPESELFVIPNNSQLNIALSSLYPDNPIYPGVGTIDDVKDLQSYDPTDVATYCAGKTIVMGRNSPNFELQKDISNIQSKCQDIKAVYFISNLETPRLIRLGVEAPGPSIVKFAMFSYKAGMQVLQVLENNPTAKFGLLNMQDAQLKNYRTGKMARFSSFGPTSTLEFKPDVSAPGTNILSLANDNKYRVMQGTSMAAPFTAGSVALVLQQYKTTGKTSSSDYQNLNLVHRVKSTLSNTSQTLPGESETTEVVGAQDVDGNQGIASVRQQGSGLISVYNAVTNDVELSNPLNNLPNFSLGEIGRTVNFDFRLTNRSHATQGYNFNSSSDVYIVRKEDKDCVRRMDSYYNTVVFTALPSNPDMNCAKYNYDAVLAGANLSANQSTITLSPGQSQLISLTLTLPQATTENSYIEGFIELLSTTGSSSLHAPYFGYYGDFYSKPLLDNPAFCSKDDARFNHYVSQGFCFDGRQTVNGLGVSALEERASLLGAIPTNVTVPGSNNSRSVIMKINPDLQAFKAGRKVVTAFYANRSIDELTVDLLDNNRQLLLPNIVALNTIVAGSFNFTWDGMRFDPSTGTYVPLEQGQYYYRVRVKGYLSRAPWQELIYPIKIDNTAPEIKNVNDNNRNWIELRQDQYMSGYDIPALGYTTDSTANVNYQNNVYPVLHLDLQDNVGFSAMESIIVMVNDPYADYGTDASSHPYPPLDNFQGIPESNYDAYQFTRADIDGRPYLVNFETEGVRFSWTQLSSLKNGDNLLRVLLTDAAGNTNEQTLTIHLELPDAIYADSDGTTRWHPGGTASNSLQLRYAYDLFCDPSRMSEVDDYEYQFRHESEYYDWFYSPNDLGDRQDWYMYCPLQRNITTSYEGDNQLLTKEKDGDGITKYTAHIQGSFYKPFFYNYIDSRKNNSACYGSGAPLEPNPDIRFGATDRFGNRTRGLGAAWNNSSCFLQDGDSKVGYVVPDADGKFDITLDVTSEISTGSYSKTFSFALDNAGEERIFYDTDIVFNPTNYDLKYVFKDQRIYSDVKQSLVEGLQPYSSAQTYSNNDDHRSVNLFSENPDTYVYQGDISYFQDLYVGDQGEFINQNSIRQTGITPNDYNKYPMVVDIPELNNGTDIQHLDLTVDATSIELADYDLVAANYSEDVVNFDVLINYTAQYSECYEIIVGQDYNPIGATLREATYCAKSSSGGFINSQARELQTSYISCRQKELAITAWNEIASVIYSDFGNGIWSVPISTEQTNQQFCQKAYDYFDSKGLNIGAAKAVQVPDTTKWVFHDLKINPQYSNVIGIRYIDHYGNTGVTYFLIGNSKIRNITNANLESFYLWNVPHGEVTNRTLPSRSYLFDIDQGSSFDRDFKVIDEANSQYSYTLRGWLDSECIDPSTLKVMASPKDQFVSVPVSNVQSDGQWTFDIPVPGRNSTVKAVRVQVNNLPQTGSYDVDKCGAGLALNTVNGTLQLMGDTTDITINQGELLSTDLEFLGNQIQPVYVDTKQLWTNSRNPLHVSGTAYSPIGMFNTIINGEVIHKDKHLCETICSRQEIEYAYQDDVELNFTTATDQRENKQIEAGVTGILDSGRSYYHTMLTVHYLNRELDIPELNINDTGKWASLSIRDAQILAEYPDDQIKVYSSVINPYVQHLSAFSADEGSLFGNLWSEVNGLVDFGMNDILYFMTGDHFTNRSRVVYMTQDGQTGLVGEDGQLIPNARNLVDGDASSLGTTGAATNTVAQFLLLLLIIGAVLRRQFMLRSYRPRT